MNNLDRTLPRNDNFEVPHHNYDKFKAIKAKYTTVKSLGRYNKKIKIKNYVQDAFI